MAKARPSSSEIDRFLEEVNRRKQQQARQSPPPPPVVVVQQPPPKQKAAYVPKAPKVQQRQVIVQEPVVRGIVVEQMPEPMKEYVPKAGASAYQIASRPPDLPRGTESAPIHHAKALIKTREGMQAMFVLNEILSPPRCKQAYRR